jgi:hypothetical protein
VGQSAKIVVAKNQMNNKKPWMQNPIQRGLD